MELDEALTTTRAVRKRLDLERPVDRATVEECLELALQAPTGGNMQLWRWVLVDDPELRAQMADVLRLSLAAFPSRPSAPADDPPDVAASKMSASVMHLNEHLQEVPMLVVPVIAGRADNGTAFERATLYGSVIPAAWSFMLALRSRGLGSAWTTIHLNREREMAELLGIPYERYTQIGLFPVAHTIGTDFRPAARRPLHEVAAWNQFPRRPPS